MNFKNGIICFSLLFLSVTDGLHAQTDLSAQAVSERIMAMKRRYPEGKRWTNRNVYRSKAESNYTGGGGCVALALILSDAAFGRLPIRRHKNLEDIKVGDMIRLNNDTHTVIVIAMDSTGYTMAEGNFNKSIHWGRRFTKEVLRKKMDYILTRYPVGK